MSSIRVHSFNSGPYGKMKKIMFTKTINLIEPKLYMNIHQMVPYTFIVFILIRNPRWAPLQSKCNIILLWNLQMIGLQNYLECSLDGPLSNVWFCVNLKSLDGHYYRTLDLQLHCTYAIMPITKNVVNSNPAQAWFT
jgi:hypothetical protein